MGNFGRSLGLPSPLKPTALTGTEAAQGVQFGTTSSCFSHVTPRTGCPAARNWQPSGPTMLPKESKVRLVTSTKAPTDAPATNCRGVGLVELPYSKGPEVLPALPRITLPSPTATVATLWKNTNVQVTMLIQLRCSLFHILFIFPSQLPYSHRRRTVPRRVGRAENEQYSWA